MGLLPYGNKLKNASQSFPAWRFFVSAGRLTRGALGKLGTSLLRVGLKEAPAT
jgi:hypothetical protein